MVLTLKCSWLFNMMVCVIIISNSDCALADVVVYRHEIFNLVESLCLTFFQCSHENENIL